MSDFLILNSSPRLNGNCTFLSNKVMELLKESNTNYEYLNISKQKINLCTACDACRYGKVKFCIYEDDMSAIYNKILLASHILFISPIYWYSFNSHMKIMIDRLYGVWTYDRYLLRDKKVACIFVYADTDVYNSGCVNAIQTFGQIFKYTQAHNCGFAFGTAHHIGDAEKNKMLIEATNLLVTKMIKGL